MIKQILSAVWSLLRARIMYWRHRFAMCEEWCATCLSKQHDLD